MCQEGVLPQVTTADEREMEEFVPVAELQVRHYHSTAPHPHTDCLLIFLEAKWEATRSSLMQCFLQGGHREGVVSIGIGSGVY